MYITFYTLYFFPPTGEEKTANLHPRDLEWLKLHCCSEKLDNCWKHLSLVLKGGIFRSVAGTLPITFLCHSYDWSGTDPNMQITLVCLFALVLTTKGMTKCDFSWI